MLCLLLQKMFSSELLEKGEEGLELPLHEELALLSLEQSRAIPGQREWKGYRALRKKLGLRR